MIVEFTGLSPEVLARRIQGAVNDPFGRESIGDALGDEIADKFRLRISVKKESPSGEAWAPWSDSYARSRQSWHSLGVDSSKMFNSIEHSTTRNSIKIKVGAPYAGYFNAAREFADLSKEDLAEIEDMLADAIERAIT